MAALGPVHFPWPFMGVETGEVVSSREKMSSAQAAAAARLFGKKPANTDPARVPKTDATTKTKGKAHQPWIEKYRPRTMADISSQDEIVQVLQNTIESKNLPHMLFYGPAGTGKTSTILALARQIYGYPHSMLCLSFVVPD